MRLSIEITEEQHRRMKASAAIQGKSIKDYVLERILSDPDEDAGFREIMDFLEPRIENAKKGKVSKSSLSDIMARAIEKNCRNNDEV